MARLRIKKEYIILAIIILLAGFLRLYGIMRPLPVQYHPDSWVTVDNAIKFMNSDFDYNRPYSWPAATLIHFYGILLYIVNIFMPVSKFMATRAIQIGNAIAGILTVAVAYFIAKRMYSVRAGVIASLLLSVMMYHMRFSRYETADSWAILFLALSFYYIIRIFGSKEHKSEPESDDLSYMGYIKDKGRFKVSKEMILLGVFISLGFATKYTDLIIGLPLLILMFYHYGFFRKIFIDRKIDRISLRGFAQSCIVIGVSALVAFTIVAPHLMFDPGSWYRGLSSEKVNHLGIHGLMPSNGLSLLDKELSTIQFLRWGFGYPLAILSLLSVAFMLYRRKKEDIVIVAMVLAYLLYVNSFPLRLIRYEVPMFTFLAVMIASMFDYSLENAKAEWQKYAVYLLLAGAVIFSFAYTMAYTNIMTNEDVRVTAGKWMQQNMPPGSQINFGYETNPWMMPVADYSRYNISITPEYIIISKAVYYNIMRLVNTPEIYVPNDWGGSFPPNEELMFYDALYNEKSSYKLAAAFSKTPSFMGYKVDDSNAIDTHVWLITHPEVRIYRRVSQLKNEQADKESS